MLTFTVTGAVLAEAVAWVSRATPTKPTIPVLSGLLMDTSDEYGLTISGYDYETRMSATVDATVTNAGKALVSARLLAAVAKTVNRNVNVTITDEDGRLKVICGRSEWALPALPVDDYPALPEPGEPIGTVNGDALRATITRTLYAAGKDDTLPMLTGVRIEAGSDERLTFVATDRFRLVAAELGWARKTDDAVALLPPARLLDAASRGIGSGEVTLTADEHGFGMVTADRVVTGRMLAAEFPRWRALVPEPSGHFAELVADDLSAVTEQAQALAATESEHTLLFRFADGEVTVSGAGDDRAAHAVCAADLTGEPIELSLNGGYVRDALAGAGTERVQLHFTTPTKPVLVLAEADPAFRSIVMPVRTPK